MRLPICLCRATILKDHGGRNHLDKCQILNTCGQIPSFHLAPSPPLHSSPSLAVSSLLPPSLHPSSFHSQMGLCEAEGHRNVSYIHTIPISRSLLVFLPHVHSSSVSHMKMHTLLSVSPSSVSPLSLSPTMLSPSLCVSLPSTEYSTYIILFGQTPWADDLIQEVTDFGLWPKTAKVNSIPGGIMLAMLLSMWLQARYISIVVGKYRHLAPQYKHA